MKRIKRMNIVIVILLLIPTSLIFTKVVFGNYTSSLLENEKSYHVNYGFEYKKYKQDTTFHLKAFLPSTNKHQEITNDSIEMENAQFEYTLDNSNKLGLWNGKITDTKTVLNYSFDVNLKPISYTINSEQLFNTVATKKKGFVSASEFIESDDNQIKSLTKSLIGNEKHISLVIKSLFTYVNEIPSETNSELMTAAEVLDKNSASCNGKSRLFVAMCRSLDIPSRVVGGIILDNTKKKTSHLWTELNLNNEWIPFDPLNGHYASLPANYLEIYKGDEFLIRRSSDMQFDYFFTTSQIVDDGSLLAQFNMFYIAEKSGLSIDVLALLMLLPIGALIVGIFRNVIGLKTFGVFLPVLIAISFLSTGVVFGLLAFIGVIVLISLMHYPLMSWGVLHVPKLVIMLIGVVFLLILLLFFGVKVEIASVGGLTFFPIVILTVSAEKYARIVVEEGLINATKILFQTLIVTLFCYMIIQSNLIFMLLMNYPELLLIMAVIALKLGKWIGIRISEYKRFNWILS